MGLDCTKETRVEVVSQDDPAGCSPPQTPNEAKHTPNRRHHRRPHDKQSSLFPIAAGSSSEIPAGPEDGGPKRTRPTLANPLRHDPHRVRRRHGSHGTLTAPHEAGVQGSSSSNSYPSSTPVSPNGSLGAEQGAKVAGMAKPRRNLRSSLSQPTPEDKAAEAQLPPSPIGAASMATNGKQPARRVATPPRHAAVPVMNAMTVNPNDFKSVLPVGPDPTLLRARHRGSDQFQPFQTENWYLMSDAALQKPPALKQSLSWSFTSRVGGGSHSHDDHNSEGGSQLRRVGTSVHSRNTNNTGAQKSPLTGSFDEDGQPAPGALIAAARLVSSSSSSSVLLSPSTVKRSSGSAPLDRTPRSISPEVGSPVTSSSAMPLAHPPTPPRTNHDVKRSPRVEAIEAGKGDPLVEEESSTISPLSPVDKLATMDDMLGAVSLNEHMSQEEQEDASQHTEVGLRTRIPFDEHRPMSAASKQMQASSSHTMNAVPPNLSSTMSPDQNLQPKVAPLPRAVQIQLSLMSPGMRLPMMDIEAYEVCMFGHEEEAQS